MAAPDPIPSRRQAAARKSAAKRRLQSPGDRRLAAWLSKHTDSFDYERIVPDPRGLGGYFRAPNDMIEAALNGPRHQFLRKLQVDDVRRHRAGEIKIRVIPTHSQARATASLRIDADAHAGQADAAALIAFLDERFFRAAGPPLYDEPSDRGHAGYFMFEMARLTWQGRTSGPGGDGGPRGDGTYVRRPAIYNDLFREVERALQLIAVHHGFAATIESNGRFSVTSREEGRRVEIAQSGAIYDAVTWDVLRRSDEERPEAAPTSASGEEQVQDRTNDTLFQRTLSAEIPGRVRLVTRGQTFRAPRCAREGDVERLQLARYPECVLHHIIRYAKAVEGSARPPIVVPEPRLTRTIPASGVQGTVKPKPKRVLRAEAAREIGGSNPFQERFAAVRQAAMRQGHLGSIAAFDMLPDHVQDALVAEAMASNIEGTGEVYRRDFAKLFQTYESGAPRERAADTLRADERVDFPLAEQILRRTVTRERLEAIRTLRSASGRRVARGRVDYDTVAKAFVCVVLNANKTGVRRDGVRVKDDHCPSTAVINWMAHFGHSVNGSWVAQVIKLFIEIGEVACVTRKYMPGKFARRYAIVGAARFLPFVVHLYQPPATEEHAVQKAGRNYDANNQLIFIMTRPGRERDLSPEGMMGTARSSPAERAADPRFGSVDAPEDRFRRPSGSRSPPNGVSPMLLA